MLARGRGRIVNVSRLSCGEPSVEQWFRNAFAHQDDVSAAVPAALVVYLAPGAADVLSGHNIRASDDVAQMVARTAEIEEHDLYVLRERENEHRHGSVTSPDAERETGDEGDGQAER